MFGATGAGMTALRRWENGGLFPRSRLDQWDKVRGIVRQTWQAQYANNVAAK